METNSEDHNNGALILENTITFQSQGRLLQELGERLVARPEVAIVELIKNSYDADSAYCSVGLTDNGKAIQITDSGHGMTESDFKNKWMRIATDDKGGRSGSLLYNRRLTGEKGIGRFAVRFLGQSLRLTSVANDTKRGIKTRVIADFNWNKIDQANDLNDAKIPYQIWNVPDSTPTGTILEIRDLRIEPTSIGKKGIRDEILKIVSPVSGLNRGRFTTLSSSGKNQDPGFEVNLPSDTAIVTPEKDPLPENIAELVLSNYVGKVSIDLNGDTLEITASVAGWPEGDITIKRKNYENSIKSGFCADIRYFPGRSSTFQGKGFDGRHAKRWVGLNSGVAIIDHGLRIRPYGYEDDDWLWLAADSSINHRQWRSPLMKDIYGQLDSDPNTNPMLYLPHQKQLIGAVFVESESGQTDGLIAAASREGYLENDSFKTIQILVRTGLELLAYVDKHNQVRLEKEEADRLAREAQGSFAAAISRIERSDTLSPVDKSRIVTEYKRLSEDLDLAKDYARKAAFNLEAMSLLGVVAGFMTHESKRIFHLLTKSVSTIRKLAKQHVGLGDDLNNLERSVKEFQGYLQYTSTFVDAMHGDVPDTQFEVLPQINEIIAKFSRFAENRGIHVAVETADKCLSPKMPVSIYTGIVLNLYTNAIKAVITASAHPRNPHIEIRSWNDKTWHHIEVVDNGVGIADEIKDRIWDPLFTTTSNSYNPLGSGMGLGLSLVKRLVEAIGGKISLSEPPAEFTTCFHVRFKQTT